MLLKKILTNLPIILSLATAVSGGYAFVNQLRVNSLNTKYEAQSEENKQLWLVHKNNLTTIEELVAQRRIDDEILFSLSQQRKLLQKQSLQMKRDIQELANNDESIKKLFTTRLPDNAIRLLVEQANPEGNAESNN